MKKQEQSDKSKKQTNELDGDELDDKFSERHPGVRYFSDKVEVKHTKFSLPAIPLNKIFKNDDKPEDIKVIPADVQSPDSLKVNKSKKEKNKAYETYEFLDVLKNVSLTPDDLEKLSKNKQISKLIEVIENLNRIILDKNLQAKILIEENENLNEKNTQLNKDNMFLGKQFDVIEKENVMLKNKLRKNDDTNTNNANTSLINNTSNIVIDNNIKSKQKTNEKKSLNLYYLNTKTENTNNLNPDLVDFDIKSDIVLTEVNNKTEELRVQKSKDIYSLSYNTNTNTISNNDKILGDIVISSDSDSNDSFEYKKKNKKHQKTDKNETLRSCTSSEFKGGDLVNDEDLISNARDLEDIANFKTDMRK